MSKSCVGEVAPATSSRVFLLNEVDFPKRVIHDRAFGVAIHKGESLLLSTSPLSAPSLPSFS